VGKGVVSFDWSGIVIKIVFEGTNISLVLSGGNLNEYNMDIDGNKLPVLIITTPNLTTYSIATGLTDSIHTLTFSKRTEAFFGVQTLHSIILDMGKWIHPTPPFPTRKLEFLGASITCGYGDEGTAPCNFSPSTEKQYQSLWYNNR